MKRTLFSAGLALLMGVTANGVADARSIPAAAGRATTPSDAGCFVMSPNIAWITNSGCGTSIFDVPLDVDAAGAKTVNMTVNAATSATRCREVSISRTGTGFLASPFQSATVFNTPTQLPLLTGANVPSMGILFVDCDVGSNDSLIEINWNQ